MGHIVRALEDGRDWPSLGANSPDRIHHMIYSHWILDMHISTESTEPGLMGETENCQGA